MSSLLKNRVARHRRAIQIYRRIKGLRGMDEHAKWQHALFLALSPAQRCQLALQTARSVLFARNSIRP
jgi:hypothetical protein